MKRLTRKQRILRNLVLFLLLAAALWAAFGFPPQTVGGMCRQVQNQYLLPEMEPVYVGRAAERGSRDWEIFSRRYTFVIARAGGDYVDFLYARVNLFLNQPSDYRMPKPEKGDLCTAWCENVYWAGPFREAASATLTVTCQRDYDQAWVQAREEQNNRLIAGEYAEAETPENTDPVVFTLEGQRLGEEVFAFDYTAGGNPDNLWWFDRSNISEPASVCEAVAAWYWWDHVDGGSSFIHADIPCVLTLYDQNGTVLDTRESSLDTYYFNRAWDPQY